MDQPFTGDILHPSSAPILHGIGLARKRDAPFHKQLEPGDKGVRTGFHHNEGAFLHAFQFIRRHKRPLRHLQTLGRIVFAPGYGAGHDRAGAKRLGDDLRRFTGGRKAARNGELAVVLNDSCALPAIVLFKLLVALNNRSDAHATRAGRRKHHFHRLYGRKGAEFIAVEKHTAWQSAAIFVCYRKDLPV